MTSKPMKDFAPGEVMVTIERMGDDKNRMEIREVFYLRGPDEPCRHEHNVRVARLGIVQGDPYEESMDGLARYVRWAKMPYCGPSEADGRTLANPLGGGTTWARRYQRELDAVLAG